MKITAALIGRIADGTATIEEMTALGREEVTRIKRDALLPQYRMQAHKVLVRKDSDETRTLPFLASDETVDRMGDIIRVKGWDLKSYRRNPVILWAHDGRSVPPIGTGVARKAEVAGGKPALLMDVTFAAADVHPFAESVFQLVKAGVLRGNSVGFRPQETRRPETEDERTRLGLGEYGVEFLKAELLEDSVVSVPANPSAVALAARELVAKSMLSSDHAERFVHDALGLQPKDYFARVRASTFVLSDIGARLDEIFRDHADEPPAAPAVEPEPAPETPPAPAADDQIETPPPAAPASEPPPAAPLPVSAAADVELVRAVATLVTAQAEQTQATRMLVDVVSDLARKVLSFNAETASTPAAGTGPGGEEESEEALGLSLSALEGLSRTVAARARGATART